MAEYPLSHGQRALWFLQRVAPNNAAHNLVHAVRLPVDTDLSLLRRAFQKLVERHPALRTTFPAPNGNPVQRVHRYKEAAFQVEDATTWDAARLNGRLAEEMFRPFDLERGPLLRVIVFKRAPEDHLLLIAMHHIIGDLWSLAIIMSETPRFYREEATGVPAAPKPLPATYTDHVREQMALLAGAQGEEMWAYWREKLAGQLPALNLPTDRTRPPVQTDRGAAQFLRFSPEFTERLRALARLRGVPLPTLLAAAFQALLHRYTGQTDVLIGFPKAGRSRKVARVIGYFVNPVVLRADLAGDPTFTAFLEQAHRTMEEASRHDAYPFPLLVERLRPARDLSRSPIFQVMFSWQKTTQLVDRDRMASFALGEEGKKLEQAGLFIESVSLPFRVTPFDLTMLMAETADELAATVEYNGDLFDAATMVRMLEHYRALLESIIADPHQRVFALSLLPEAERGQVLTGFNHTAFTEPGDQCLHHLFEAQVERTPDAVALVFEQKQLTYRELDRQANQLAHHLQELGVGPEVLVGICVERSPEMIIGLLGVLKAGGAYLPLDPAYPAERLRFMLEDADVQTLLTQKHLSAECGVRIADCHPSTPARTA